MMCIHCLVLFPLLGSYVGYEYIEVNQFHLMLATDEKEMASINLFLHGALILRLFTNMNLKSFKSSYLILYYFETNVMLTFFFLIVN